MPREAAGHPRILENMTSHHGGRETQWAGLECAAIYCQPLALLVSGSQDDLHLCVFSQCCSMPVWFPSRRFSLLSALVVCCFLNSSPALLPLSPCISFFTLLLSSSLGLSLLLFFPHTSPPQCSGAGHRHVGVGLSPNQGRTGGRVT